MAKMNLKDHTKGYDHQSEGGKPKVKNGSYHVVNLTMKRATVGEKGTKKVALKVRVLKALEPENADAVGTDFFIDLWAAWTKTFNAARLTYMLMACGADPSSLNDFDPDDDPAMAHGLTGVPYLVKIDVRENEGKDGKVFVNVDLVETKILEPKTRDLYTKAPDWKALVGDPNERIVRDEDFPAREGKGGKKDSGTKTRRGGGPKTEGPKQDDVPPYEGDPFAGPEGG